MTTNKPSIAIQNDPIAVMLSFATTSYHAAAAATTAAPIHMTTGTLEA